MSKEAGETIKVEQASLRQIVAETEVVMMDGVVSLQGCLLCYAYHVPSVNLQFYTLHPVFSLSFAFRCGHKRSTLLIVPLGGTWRHPRSTYILAGGILGKSTTFDLFIALSHLGRLVSLSRKRGSAHRSDPREVLFDDDDDVAAT